jgi:Ca-activated chloride channel homolog
MLASRPMLLAVTLLASVLPLPLAAQGRLIPRPCQRGDCPPPVRPCIAGGCPLPGVAIERSASDVRVELRDRVLRYQVDERFVNYGGVVGEADYVFPLPKNAAFEGLKLEINGELVAGEIMDAEHARQTYEAIVRQQRDPALVEWMGHGLLRARIFPIAPGEEKRVVVRFQAVAEREGDALRVEYGRGAGSTGLGARSRSFIRTTHSTAPPTRLPTPCGCGARAAAAAWWRWRGTHRT